MNIWDIDKAFLFIVLVLPGFISLKVYDLIVAGDKRDFSKSIVESIAFSVLNFATLSWLVIVIIQPDFAKDHAFLYWASLFVIFIAAPAIWPFVYIRISKLIIFKKHLLTPINQPWDKVFSKRESYWITVYLKNGKVIKGKYGLNSNASAYPKERQIYIQELWSNGENGGFGNKVKRTKGALIFEDEISYIEFHGK
ncbi:MAG: DUF6338 family protein [Candidatus Thiodiazotropha sp. LLP2]